MITPIQHTLRERLKVLQDTDYRAFTLPLIPHIERYIGVRLPILRKLAREVASAEWIAEQEERTDERYMEEVMLWGMAIGGAKSTAEERIRRFERFVPHIDNWSVCDSCAPTLKPSERPAFWAFIRPMFHHENPWAVRFAVVMALRNFTDGEHLEQLLELYPAIRTDHYYVRMGIAWAVSVAFTRYPDRLKQWLSDDCPLEDWTFNKSLQKICESLRVDRATKNEIRTWKRR